MSEAEVSKNMLVVDTSSTARQYIRELLKEFPLNFHEASSGSEALELCTSHTMDIITLPIELPDGDGFSVCSRLRNAASQTDLYRSSGANIIIVTGSDNLDNRIRGFNSGASLFIKKGSGLQELTNITRKIIHPENSLQSARVIIVDDSDVSTILIQRILERNGAQVSTFSNAEEGLEYLYSETRDIDMIISDYNMTGMTGAAFCREVRFRGNYDRIPFIVLTGTEEKETVIEIYDSGATDYIAKPFVREEFIARVRIHIENRMLWKERLK
jgi:DNA-binding response OmpR family regulator